MQPRQTTETSRPVLPSLVYRTSHLSSSSSRENYTSPRGRATRLEEASPATRSGLGDREPCSRFGPQAGSVGACIRERFDGYGPEAKARVVHALVEALHDGRVLR